jgi:alpha-amylase/alpha-mannosidase (GH57 family)
LDEFLLGGTKDSGGNLLKEYAEEGQLELMESYFHSMKPLFAPSKLQDGKINWHTEIKPHVSSHPDLYLI